MVPEYWSRHARLHSCLGRLDWSAFLCNVNVVASDACVWRAEFLHYCMQWKAGQHDAVRRVRLSRSVAMDEVNPCLYRESMKPRDASIKVVGDGEYTYSEIFHPIGP